MLSMMGLGRVKCGCASLSGRMRQACVFIQQRERRAEFRGARRFIERSIATCVAHTGAPVFCGSDASRDCGIVSLLRGLGAHLHLRRCLGLRRERGRFRSTGRRRGAGSGWVRIGGLRARRHAGCQRDQPRRPPMLQMKKLSVALALCGAAALNATAHAADIKVGIALDISGPFSALGAEARDGFELAIEKLGSKLGGQPAEFIRTDFGGNPEQANQLVARYLQREKIDFFTGPIGSNAALAVGPALFAAKVPYLSSNPGPSAYAGDKCNPYFFAQYQNDTYDEAAGKVANEKGYQNVVLIAPNYPAGKDHLNGFKRLYKGGVK